uniref:Anti-PCD protein n=1 Tax=Solanum tuberosum TaxID=4113 RepID=M1A363_SOLTU
MEASKKLFAVFLICIFVISSCVDISMATKEINDEKFRNTYEDMAVEYEKCCTKCVILCAANGKEKTACETHCGGECVAQILQDFAEDIDKMKH